MAIPDLPSVLRTKIELDPVTGCWLWIAALRYGYGVVRYDGKARTAHRVIYALLVGDPGPELDHLCRVRRCVNPAHLEPVDHLENVRRGDAGKHNATTWPEGRLCPRGHVMAGTNVYVHYSERLRRTNRQCRQCKHEAYVRRRDHLPI